MFTLCLQCHLKHQLEYVTRALHVRRHISGTYRIIWVEGFSFIHYDKDTPLCSKGFILFHLTRDRISKAFIFVQARIFLGFMSFHVLCLKEWRPTFSSIMQAIFVAWLWRGFHWHEGASMALIQFRMALVRILGSLITSCNVLILSEGMLLIFFKTFYWLNFSYLFMEIFTLGVGIWNLFNMVL